MARVFFRCAKQWTRLNAKQFSMLDSMLDFFIPKVGHEVGFCPKTNFMIKFFAQNVEHEVEHCRIVLCPYSKKFFMLQSRKRHHDTCAKSGSPPCSTQCSTFNPRKVGRRVGFRQKPSPCSTFSPSKVGHEVEHYHPAKRRGTWQ